MKKQILMIAGLMLIFCSAHADMNSIGGFHIVGTDPSGFISNAVPEALGEPMALMESGGGVLPEMEITETIRSQAAALNNDPVEIFEFVRNRIGFELYYGCFKGAEGTLLSGFGNDLDQCTLLGALLKAADATIEVSYVRGNVIYTGEFLMDLTGCPTNYFQNLNPYFLINAPVQRIDGWEFDKHYWLKATINGTTYQLDPSFVQHEAVPADAETILTEVTGYTRTNLLNAASSGANVFTAEQVQNVNGTAVENILRDYVAQIHQAQKDGDSDIEQLIGQRRVEEQSISGLSTNLPPDMVRVASSSVLSSLPDNMFARYELTHESGFSSVALKGYELAGKRVTVFYDSNDGNRPVLRLDGEEKARGTSGLTVGQVKNLTLKVLLPSFFGMYEKSNAFKPCDLVVGYSYNIVTDFLTASPKILARESRKLAAYRAQGLADSSEEVLGTTLHLMGLVYCHQDTMQAKLLSRLTGVPATVLCHNGVVAQESGYYIDLPQNLGLCVMTMPKASSWVLSSTFFGSGLEHGMLEQIMGPEHPGVSTTKGIALNNSAGKHTYYATSSNWKNGLNVRSKLSGYTTDQKDDLENNYINKGYNLLLPRDPVSVGDWEGIAYYGIQPLTIHSIISGEYGTQNGGYSGYQGYIPPPVVNTVTRTTYIPPPPPPIQLFRPKSIEPVDLYSGDYLFDHTDLTLSGPLPLRLSRHYNSGQVAANGVMGPGWGHSLQIEIDEHSNGDSAFGERTPADAAAILASHMVSLDLMRNENNAKGWTISAIAAKWALDSVVENTITVRIGKSGQQFTRLPNGELNPPPGSTDELIQTNGVYVLKERNANTYTFNTNNLIAEIEDTDGNTLTFTYNAQTNLQSVTNSFGLSMTFNYTSNLLTSVSDNTGRSIDYQYDYASGNLTNFVDAENFDWGIAYSDTNHPSAITSLTDPEEITTIQNLYNSLGVVTQQVSATSNLWNFYTSDSQSIEEDPFGGKTIYRFDAKGRTVQTQRADGSTVRSQYNGRDQVTNAVNAAGVTNLFVYDTHHNLLLKTEAAGTPEEVRTGYGYDAQHHLRFVTNALGTAEQTVTEITYTATHKPDIVTEAKGTPEERTTDYNYNSNGLMEQVSEGSGLRVTTYSNFDSHGNAQTVNSTDAGTISRTFNARGDLETLTVDGKTAAFGYNALRLPTAVTNALGTADQTVTSKSYYDNGLLKTSTDARSKITRYFWTPAYKPAGVIYPDTGSTTNLYDEADRLFAVRDAKGSWATNTLDSVGRPVFVSSVYSSVSNQYNSADNVTNSAVDPDGLNLWSRSEYDNLNRLKNQQTAIGTQQFFYDLLGRTTNLIDQASKHWKTEYDALSRVKKTFRPSENFEEYSFDALGNRTRFWNADRNSITFGMDAQGRVTSITNAISKVTEFGYNGDGTLDWRRNAELELTQYGYDSLSRLIAVTNDGVEVATFDYDANGNVLSAANTNATVTFGYDEMNRLTASTQSVHSVFSVVQNVYDLNGNRTNIVYPGGLTVSYEFGADNRLESVTTKTANDTKTISFGYDTANRLDGISYPNGVNSTFGYDAESRITAIEHGSFIDRTIQRNALGFKLTELVDAGLKPTVPATKRSIKTHNDADQLTSERIQTAVTNWTEIDYIYNDNGGLDTVMPANEASTSYSYDYDNRLETVSGGSQSLDVEYLYDASGARIGRVENSATNYFIVDYADGLKRPLAETDASGNITRYYVWSGSQLLCHIEADGTTRYYHADELGSTLALTDESGNVTDQFAYMSYGYATHSGTNSTPFQWLGGYGVYYDADTQLHLTLHRAYSSSMKRFISPDPLGIDGGVNLYAYGDLNPLFKVDPTGEYAWVIAGAIIGAAIDGGIDLAMQMRSGDPINWKQFGAATARGAIVGTVSSLAGPAAGTLVKGAGGLATGVGAKVVSTGISAAGGAGGQMTYNAMQGNDLSDGVGTAALFGAAGQTVANTFPVKGMSTLAQAKYFSPKSLPSMFATKNARLLSASIFSSSSVGAGSYFVPQVKQSQPSVFNTSFSSINYGGIDNGISK